jgi:putative transposase
MNQLYKALNISKQAVSQYAKRDANFNHELMTLLVDVEHLRNEHPGCGLEKMYYTLKPSFLGRDRFIELFMDMGFRVKMHKNYRRTTHSVFNQYSNLIKGMKVDAPAMIWQSDITYIEVAGKFYYAVFLIDVYTKKIVGHQVSNHMRATANLKALEIAVQKHQAPLIHHSDRGSQYICHKYTALLAANSCKISMALTAQDNAYAERINRTIKEEYLDHWKPKTFRQLMRMLNRAVLHYNTKRLHNHLNRMTPVDFETQCQKNILLQRPIITIFNNEFMPKTVNPF